jgi:hypothetical protein
MTAPMSSSLGHWRVTTTTPDGPIDSWHDYENEAYMAAGAARADAEADRTNATLITIHHWSAADSQWQPSDTVYKRGV